MTERFFVILDHFLHFYPPKNPKNQNFENMKKMPGDIIILYKCIKNHDHMLYCSWDMASGRCYFSFWAIFCPLPPWQPEKWKFQKNKKKPPKLEISSFYKSVPEIIIIWYTVPEMRCVTDVIVIFRFGLLFVVLPPLQPKNLKFQKNEENGWRYHITYVYQKLWLDDVWFLRYGVR